jgi:hypothetical protein
MVTFLGGAICEGSDSPALNGLPRKVIYTLECGESQDNNVRPSPIENNINITEYSLS